MKTFLGVVCAALLASAVLAEVSPSLMRAALGAKWSSFKAKHGKQYQPSEESHRMTLFLEKTRLIEEHNARFHQGLESYTLAHNEFSDRTPEEWRSLQGLVISPSAALANDSLHISSSGVTLPQELDLRTTGCIQKAKNQGYVCGSCYTFAAIGAFEFAHCNKNGKLYDLSEQHLVDCAGFGCGGGDMGRMYPYLMANGGAILQKDYPYTAQTGTCKAQSKTRVAQVASYKRVPEGDEDALLNAVATIGAIGVSYDARDPKHGNYHDGIIDDIPGCGSAITHSVVLVGYGTENGKKYWLLKQSLGASYGDNGFFKMARGKNFCGITSYSFYPVSV